jgi:hypothetical protein
MSGHPRRSELGPHDGSKPYAVLESTAPFVLTLIRSGPDSERRCYDVPLEFSSRAVITGGRIMSAFETIKAAYGERLE